jgi:hypothetical protein
MLPTPLQAIAAAAALLEASSVLHPAAAEVRQLLAYLLLQVCYVLAAVAPVSASSMHPC